MNTLPQAFGIAKYGIEVTGEIIASQKVAGRYSLRITRQTVSGGSNFNRFQESKLAEMTEEVEKLLAAEMNNRKEFVQVKRGVWEVVLQSEPEEDEDEERENLRPLTEQEIYGDDYEEIHQWEEEERNRWQAEHPEVLIYRPIVQEAQEAIVNNVFSIPVTLSCGHISYIVSRQLLKKEDREWTFRQVCAACKGISEAEVWKMVCR